MQAGEGEPLCPIHGLEVNPFPSRFICRTSPLGDSAHRLGKYETFRGKNLFRKINLLGKGLIQGISRD